MGLLQVKLSGKLEEEIRKYNRRRGDLSRIAEEAFNLWLEKQKEKERKQKS